MDRSIEMNRKSEELLHVYAEEIIRRLAASEPRIYEGKDEFICGNCRSHSGLYEKLKHTDSCLYRAAVKWAKEAGEERAKGEQNE